MAMARWMAVGGGQLSPDEDVPMSEGFMKDGLVLPWPSAKLTCSQLSTGKLPASTAALSEQAGYQLSCVHIKHVCHFSPNVVPRAPVF